jgi:hypothetical protein
MRKIPTIFLRNEDRKFVSREPNPECMWVFEGEGRATRKYDGTCTMFDGSEWWARREVKDGKQAPDGFVLVQHDDITGKSVGWQPYKQSSFARYLDEAVANSTEPFEPGTYELTGPRINNNPEGFYNHFLIKHGNHVFGDFTINPRTYDSIRKFLVRFPAGMAGEGIVFWRGGPDDDMAKIKFTDFTDFTDSANKDK